MRTRGPLRTAAVAALALLATAEIVARLQGDRLCSDHPGVFYERDDALGWRHVPNLVGRAGTCGSDAIPGMPLATDAAGLLGPPRPVDKPPGTVRFLVLGGNATEGLGVPVDETMPRLLEQYVDERRGARLEVLNAATGGWAIDQSLVFFRRYGAARAPDLVLLVLDPLHDIGSISPAALAAMGRRVPAKPFFTLVDDRVVPAPPFAIAPTPDPPPVPGPVASTSALYRLAGAIPRHTGEPMAWAALGTFPHGTPDEERERSFALLQALLATLRDEVATAGGRLIAVVAAVPGAHGPDAVGAHERARLTAIAGDLGVPLVDLTDPMVGLEVQDLAFVAGSVRLSGPGHARAASAIWQFLRDDRLLPPAIVPATMTGGGRAVPGLADAPRVAADALWAFRYGLMGRFIQMGLLAVCVVWLASALPPAGRDWALVAVGAGVLAIFTGPAPALFALAVVAGAYGGVELLPRPRGVVLLLLFGGALLVAATLQQRVHVTGESWDVPVMLGAASNVVALRLLAYAADRRRGAARLPVRHFLGALFFFPTMPTGPIDRPHAFAARWTARDGRLGAWDVLVGLGRIALGWVQWTLAPVFLLLPNSDVFASGGAGFGRARLWLFVAEAMVLLTLLLAGWTNVAVGLARLCGDEPPENLRAPWAARDVGDFWRRWHASLGSWLRDYVYVPLGGRTAPGRAVLAAFVAGAAWYGWGIVKMLGYRAYVPPLWKGLALCAGMNAAAVLVGRSLGGGRAGEPGSSGRVWRAAATLVFVSLAWLPLVMPLATPLGSLASVYMRLFFLR